jgi:cold-inducible RNA-binding protein
LKNIFVGNLDFDSTEDQLRTLFTAHGTVESVTIVKDRDTGQPRGFAFVEMKEAEEAQTAILSLDGIFLKDRALRVSEARPKLVHDERPDSSGSRDHRRHRI